MQTKELYNMTEREVLDEIDKGRREEDDYARWMDMQDELAALRADAREEFGL